MSSITRWCCGTTTRWSLLKQALASTTRLSSFVMFILIGATVFSMVFQAADGPKWVEHLLSDLPGGQVGFLVLVNFMIFFLAFFLDYFELSFIVVPLLAPVADKLGIDLIWFGVLLAVNMQTSFLCSISTYRYSLSVMIRQQPAP